MLRLFCCGKPPEETPAKSPTLIKLQLGLRSATRKLKPPSDPLLIRLQGAHNLSQLDPRMNGTPSVFVKAGDKEMKAKQDPNSSVLKFRFRTTQQADQQNQRK